MMDGRHVGLGVLHWTLASPRQIDLIERSSQQPSTRPAALPTCTALTSPSIITIAVATIIPRGAPVPPRDALTPPSRLFLCAFHDSPAPAPALLLLPPLLRAECIHSLLPPPPNSGWHLDNTPTTSTTTSTTARSPLPDLRAHPRVAGPVRFVPPIFPCASLALRAAGRRLQLRAAL